MRRHRLIGAALAAGLGLHAVAADAEELGTLSVTRTAAAKGCPDAHALAARVEQVVGRAVLVPVGGQGAGADDDAIRFSVDMSAANGRFAARVRMEGKATGERTMDDRGSNCDGLADAVAVTLALLLDNDAVEIVKPRPRAVDPPRPPRPDPMLQDVPPDVGEASPTLVFDLAFAQTTSLLDQSALGIDTGLDFFFTDELSVGVGVLYLPDDVVKYRGEDLELSLVAVSARLCATLFRDVSVMAVRVCAFPAVGELSAEAQTYEVSPSNNTTWVGGGTSLGGEGHLIGALSFGGQVSAYIPASRSVRLEARDGDQPDDRAGVGFRTDSLGIETALFLRIRAL